MKKKELRFFVGLALAAFSVFLAIHYWEHAAGLLKKVFAAAFPLIVGAVFAYPVNILVSFYERHFFKNSKSKLIIKGRRAVCVVLAVLTIVAILAVVVALVVPQVTECVKLVIAKLPAFMDGVVKKLAEFDIVPENIIKSLSAIDWKSKIAENIKTITSGFGSVMDVVVSTVSSVVSGVTTTFLALIFALYVLLSKNVLVSQVKKLAKHYIPEKAHYRLSYFVTVADDCFHKFIVAQCTESVILGVLCMIGMLILRLPYAAMIGAVICVTAFIPVVGGLIGGGIGAFLILMESPVKALIFLIFIVLLQQIEGDLIYPKVVGTSIGLPGIWVLVAITVGGGVFGILGMLLGVPVASTAYRLLKNDVYGIDEAHIAEAKKAKQESEQAQKQENQPTK